MGHPSWTISRSARGQPDRSLKPASSATQMAGGTRPSALLAVPIPGSGGPGSLLACHGRWCPPTGQFRTSCERPRESVRIGTD
jgi:hypothetical protein